METVKMTQSLIQELLNISQGNTLTVFCQHDSRFHFFAGLGDLGLTTEAETNSVSIYVKAYIKQDQRVPVPVKVTWSNELDSWVMPNQPKFKTGIVVNCKMLSGSHAECLVEVLEDTGGTLKVKCVEGKKAGEEFTLNHVQYDKYVEIGVNFKSTYYLVGTVTS